MRGMKKKLFDLEGHANSLDGFQSTIMRTPFRPWLLRSQLEHNGTDVLDIDWLQIVGACHARL